LRAQEELGRLYRDLQSKSAALEEELAEMKKMRTATALDPSAATGINWSALNVADMLKVVQLFGGPAPDIAGVQDKRARLAESITESLLSLGDD